MYGKIFKQIFDSSIADNWKARHVFMDLIILADAEGVVDMTPEAIARRANLPIEMVQEALNVLQQPDVRSRTKAHEGRRLVPIDPNRGWGWQIVNYEVYRNMRDEEDRKYYMRNYMRAYRVGERKEHVNPVNDVNNGKPPLAQGYPSSSPSSLENRGVGEGASDLPSLPEAITQTMTCGIPEDFVRYVYSKWYERDGRDGNGVPVAWLRHVKGRWDRECSAWRRGIHTGQRNGEDKHQNNGAPLWRKIQVLEDEISKHPANVNSTFHRRDCTDLEREALRNLRERLKALKAQQTQEATNG